MNIENESEKSLAVITARGGSKRIPKKNIKEFCGKPIIAYSIEAAIASGLFDEVMVSIDSEEIAEISRKYGADVPFMRSEATSNDYATTSDVLIEVLNEYSKIGKKFKYLACLYPTNPFISIELLKEGMNKLEMQKCAQVNPVVQFSFPPQRSFIIDENNNLKFKWEKFRNSRSQDLEPMYHDAGQFYCYDVEKYLECNGQIKDNIVPLILPEYLVQDIDNESDWKMAELKYELLKHMK